MIDERAPVRDMKEEVAMGRQSRMHMGAAGHRAARWIAAALTVVCVVACSSDDSAGGPDVIGPATPGGMQPPTPAAPGVTPGDDGTQDAPPITTMPPAVSMPGDDGVPASTGDDDGSAGTGSAGDGDSIDMPQPAVPTVATLYWLDIMGNGVYRSEESDFGASERIVRTNTAPDGVAVDVAGGKVYWSNMGSLLGTGGGTLQRANLDGSGVETIVPSGTTRTPKQIQLDLVNGHVYWCDREGAKVWRVGLDGSNPETLVSEHGFTELVGVALDVEMGHVYFSDRIERKILRMGLDMPAGEDHATRTDIEELFIFASGAMPIDLDVDLEARQLYWTDRQLGTVHRAGMDMPAGESPSARSDMETLVDGLGDPIGLSLNHEDGTMFYTELGGDVWQANLDGSSPRTVASSGSATGVAIAHLPEP